MSATSPTSGRRTFNDIGLKDSSLAEWTSEIRKLQSEVDKEAEEESKRLQEEIARSRLEREKRRQSNRRSGMGGMDSSGAGAGAGIASGTNSQGVSVGILTDPTNSAGARDEAPKDMLGVIDKQRNQSDALKKLIGANHVVVDSPAALTR